MSILSKSSIYALRAVMYVAATHVEGQYVSIREISDQLGISFHFLTKILQQLTESGIMTSYRGPRGGVALARGAAEVSVKDIIDSIQGRQMFESCLLGLEGCGERTPCPLHAQWAEERSRLESVFRGASLADLARDVRLKKLRLADDAPVPRGRKR